jgi:hypothetical protein
MKNFLKTLYVVCTSIGQARAAAALARTGHVDQAKALMLSN